MKDLATDFWPLKSALEEGGIGLTLYLDVIWLLNFCIDLLLLQLTAFILKRRVRIWRLVAGALIGSVFIFFLFTPLSGVMYHPLVKLGYSVLITFSVFGYKRFYPFVQVLFMFYFVTFAIGGGMFALHYFMQGGGTILSGIASHTTPYGDVFSWTFVLVGFACLWFFSRQRVQHIKAKKIHYEQRVVVEIDVENVHIQALGFIDSGNHLHDPITQTPVMILDLQAFAEKFPPTLVQKARQPESFFEGSEALVPEWEARVRLIPFRGVGRGQNFLLALKPDRVKIKQGEDVYHCKKVFIALNEQSLSAEGEFTCIVHPKLLANQKEQPAS